MRRLAIVLAAAILGAMSALGSDTREIKIRRTDSLAIRELQRRGSEIEAARRQVELAAKALEADTAAVMSELRDRYGILASEDLMLMPGRDVIAVVTSPR